MYKTIICDIQGVLLISSGFNENLADLLVKNKGKSYEKLILYSNLGSKSIESLENRYPEFFKFVDKTYSYECVQYPKPDSRGFKEILQENNIEANQTIFIDDSKGNVDVAREVGFETIYYKSSEDLITLERLLLP